MKKKVLLLISFVFAITFSEMVIRYIIGFPDFGVEKYVVGLDMRGFDKCRVYKPKSKYYTIEGGLKTFKRNNIGLPGNDYQDSLLNIILLGSSFVEAKEVDPCKMASVVLNEYCRKRGYQVLNLGYRGCTPYEQYTRLQYYGEMYKPDVVVLILDSTYDSWYSSRKHPIVNAEKIGKFGTTDTNLYHNVYKDLRNFSSLVNLVVPGLFVGSKKTDDDAQQLALENELIDQSSISKLIQSIELIKQNCNRLIVVSFIDNPKALNFVKDNLSKCNLSLFQIDLKKPQNLVNGRGHLNEKGNLLLGSFIYRVLDKHVFSKEAQ